ncbi:hypothetical protein FOZ63_022332, partial [Perkinsus olseni]
MSPLSREAAYSGITRWYSADIPCRGNNQGEWLPKPSRGLHRSDTGFFNGVKETINPIGVSKGHWFLLPPPKPPTPGPVFGPIPPKPQPKRSLWKNSLQPLEPFKTPRSLARSGSCLSYFGRRTRGHLNPDTVAQAHHRAGGLSTWKARRWHVTSTSLPIALVDPRGQLSSILSEVGSIDLSGCLPGPLMREAPGALTSLGKAQMRVMGHRYQYIFEDLAHQKVEVFSSSKERARLSAEAFVEGFFDGEEAAAAAVQVKDGLLRPDSPELKKLLIEKERTPEYERKARGDFAHLMDAFRLTEIGQLRELGD